MVVDLILGLVDILTGIFLLSSFLPYLPGSGFLLGLSVFILLKGAWYMITGITEQKKEKKITKIVLFAGFDLVSALLLFLIYLGYPTPVYSVMGILMVFKGVWSMMTGLTD